jgi:hypothetical protein
VLPLFSVGYRHKPDGTPTTADPVPYLIKPPAKKIILPAKDHNVDSIMMIAGEIMVIPEKIKLSSMPSCTSREQC